MGDTIESAIWRKSSYSGGNGGNCVEVARNLPGIIAVRDSRDTAGPALTFARVDWADFAARVKAGDFDLA
jgi:hypothetical protein